MRQTFAIALATGGLMVILIGLVNLFFVYRAPRSRFALRWLYPVESVTPRYRRATVLTNAAFVLLGVSQILLGLGTANLLPPPFDLVAISVMIAAIVCMVASWRVRRRAKRPDAP